LPSSFQLRFRSVYQKWSKSGWAQTHASSIPWWSSAQIGPICPDARAHERARCQYSTAPTVA
jgi:hypothetical protein